MNQDIFYKGAKSGYGYGAVSGIFRRDPISGRLSLLEKEESKVVSVERRSTSLHSSGYSSKPKSQGDSLSDITG
jgi:hypothetical protein